MKPDITLKLEAYCRERNEFSSRLTEKTLGSWPYILSKKRWEHADTYYMEMVEVSCAAYILRDHRAWSNIAEGLKVFGIQNAPFIRPPFMDRFIHQVVVLASTADWKGAAEVIERALAGTAKRKWIPDDVARVTLLAFHGRKQDAQREADLLNSKVESRDMKRAEAEYVLAMMPAVRDYLAGDWDSMGRTGQKLDEYLEKSRRTISKKMYDAILPVHYLDFPFSLLCFGAKSIGAKLPRFECADVEWMAKGGD